MDAATQQPGGRWGARAAFVAALAALLAWGSPARASHDGTFDPDDDGDEGEIYVLGAILAGIAATAPFWGPPAALGDAGLTTEGRFAKYPYANGDGPYLRPGNDIEGRYFAGSWLADYVYDAGIDQFHTQLALDTAPRFGFDIEFSDIAGESPELPLGEMQTGDFNILLRFAQGERIQFRTGGGFRWLSDERDTNYGFNFAYGFDIQMMRPIVVSFMADLGRVRDEPAYHVRLTVGAILWRTEAFAGIDYLSLEDREVAGPTAGLRVWF
jgi:hypothetical protein